MPGLDGEPPVWVLGLAGVLQQCQDGYAMVSEVVALTTPGPLASWVCAALLLLLQLW